MHAKSLKGLNESGAHAILPIGGYFSWEFNRKFGEYPHCDGTLLNAGRYALEYILRNIDCIKTVFIPYFTCEVVLQPIEHLGLKFKFYRINTELEISENIVLGSNDYLIYTNYFGIKDSYIDILASIYGKNLIVDNSQAFFAKPNTKCFQFYSPRKFVGCPDGGIISPFIKSEITLPQGKSHDRCSALLQRSDGEISMGYRSFHEIDDALKEEGMLAMSNLTQQILGSLDYKDIVERRRLNFHFLDQSLHSSNRLNSIIPDTSLDGNVCPMVYPYWTEDLTLRHRLIENKVFVAKYWPNVLTWCQPTDLDYQLTEQIIPLPIDQRYGEEEMNYILSLIR